MKSRHMIIFPLIGIVTAMAVLGSASISKNDFLKPAKADPTNLTLGTACFSQVSDTLQDEGTFDSYTSASNKVTWKYHNAKRHGDGETKSLLLRKTAYGNVNFSDNYVGNINPITSTTNITVNFIGAKYVRVYAGLNPNVDSSFYYVALLDSSTSTFSTENANKYYYYRFVNDDHDNNDCIISSIEISYSCNAEDRTDLIAKQAQKSDSFNTVSAGKASPTYVTDAVYDSNYSIKSVRTIDTTTYYFVAPTSIPVGDISNWVVEIYQYVSADYVNTDSKAKEYGVVRPQNGTSSVDSLSISFTNTDAGAGWVKQVYECKNLTANSKVINGFRFNAHRARKDGNEGYCLFGGLRNYLSNAYPTYAPALDDNDLAVASNVVLPPYKQGDAYLAEDCVYKTYNASGLDESISSVLFKANKTASFSTTSLGLTDSTLNLTTDGSKVVEFYIYLAHAKATESNNKTKMKLQVGVIDGSKVYLSNNTITNHEEAGVDGIGRTDLGDGWYKYSYPISYFGTTMMDNKTDTGSGDFAFLFIQLESSTVTQEDIDAGYYYVIDRLSVTNPAN